MTATNHALTGAAIGIFISNPAAALVTAFISHFLLDALPHYGSSDEKYLKSKRFALYLVLEAFLCFLIVLMLFILRPHHWLIAAICAFLAASPDLYWIRKYRAARANRNYRENMFGRFAGRIQWFQKPIGAYVEVAWLIGIIILLLPVL